MKLSSLSKKILSALIIMSFLLVPVSGSAENAASDGYEQELALLNDLNFFPDELNKPLNSDKGFTKAEFAALICGIMGYNEYNGNDSSLNFADVSETNKYYSDIMNLRKYGLANGDGSGNFSPNTKISYEQAVKIIMTALGYGDLAMYRGGYPSGYLLVARENGVLDGVSASDKDYISCRAALRLCANALNTKVLEYESFSSDGSTVSNKEGKTLLNVCHDIYAYEGVITGIGYDLLAEFGSLGKDEVLIDGSSYTLDSKKDYSDYFGYRVDFYCKGNKNTILAINEGEHENKLLTLRPDDIISCSGGSLNYYDGDRERKASFTLETDIMYNGRTYSLVQDSDFLIKSGELKLIDNNGDGKYELVCIEAPENIVVKKCDDDNKIIYDMYSSDNNLSLETTKDYAFIDEYGNSMEFFEVGEYDVISVFKAKNNDFALLVYSFGETEGAVDEIDTSESKITIDGVKYGYSENFLPQSGKIDIGTSGLFVLDIYGNIAALKPYESSYVFGYITEIAKNSGLDTAVKVKIFTTDGDFKIFDTGDKIKLDGESIDSTSLRSAFLVNDSFEEQLIRYYTVNGKISAIDTTSADKSESDIVFSEIYTDFDDSGERVGDGSQWNIYQRVFGMKVPITSGTDVFIIGDNEKDYLHRDWSYFVQDTAYYITAYGLSKDAHVADAIVLYETSSAISIDKNISYTVVDHVSSFIDEDGEQTYKLYGVSDGAEVEYTAYEASVIDEIKTINPDSGEEYHTLGYGDIVKLALDRNSGKIKTIKLFYEYDSDTLIKNVALADEVGNSERTMKANAYSEKDGIIWLTQNPLTDTDIKLGVKDIEAINAQYYTIYKYTENRGKKTIAISTINDIIDYKSTSENFSKLIICAKYNDPGMIVISDR